MKEILLVIVLPELDNDENEQPTDTKSTSQRPSTILCTEQHSQDKNGNQDNQQPRPTTKESDLII